MKERPILFSAPMVQAILEGRKTQTRRVIKAPKKAFGFRINSSIDGRYKWPEAIDADERGLSGEINIKNLYGTIGDRLWVRETFRPIDQETGGFLYEYAATEKINIIDSWKPSIHMPRIASRITLEITGVRVEQLNDISENDALNEGVKVIEKDEAYHDYEGGIGSYATARGSFFSLWNSINGKESLASNPWVWVIEFKRVEVKS